MSSARLLTLGSTHFRIKCTFTSKTTTTLKKASKLFKKQPKNKVSLTPKFIENIKEWPKLLNAEVEAQFEKLHELIRTKADWKVIEERGLCVGNLIAKSKYYEVASGEIVCLTGDSIGKARWLRPGLPALLHRLNEEGDLERVSDGHVLDAADGLLKMCLYYDKKFDFTTKNYIVTPSANSGAIRYFQNVLKDSSTLSSDSIHLVNLAYRSVPMPSIHDRKVTNLPESLNPSQQSAVSAALNTKRNLLCIQGPPGTGKTRVIAEIVHQLTKKKKKVLICAPTHVAVANARDATFRRMKDEIEEDVIKQQLCILNNTKTEFQNHVNAQKLVEVNSALAKTPKTDPLYKSLAYQSYSLRTGIYRSIFSTRRAIFTTMGTSSIQKLPEYSWNADVMLVDEAAQCTEPATWVPVLTTPSCKKLVLVGDQKQLPAVILSDKGKKRRLNLSLMEKLADEFANNNINILLNEQFRMNEKIMHWSNEVFYENQLTAHPTVSNIKLSDICSNLPVNHVLNNPIFMIDMKNIEDRSQEGIRSHSFINTDELNIITNYVSRLVCDLGVDPVNIAVIAPYYAQIEKIRQHIPFRVDVNTVDAFQGHEREVVVFCIVRDNEEGVIGFLNETRRLNVAITRAKRQFVLIGNSRMIMRNEHLRKLFKHLQSQKVVFGVEVLDAFNNLDPIGLPPSDKNYDITGYSE